MGRDPYIEVCLWHRIELEMMPKSISSVPRSPIELVLLCPACAHEINESIRAAMRGMRRHGYNARARQRISPQVPNWELIGR